MKSTKPMNKNSAKAYKALLIEAKSLRQRGGKNAYRRAVLLVKVYNDQEFRSDNHMFDGDKLLNILDEYVDDLCATFYELKLILEHFPNEEQWADGRIYKMLQEVLANAKTEPKSVSPKKREDPYAIARREKARMSAIIDELMERIKQLERENAELREKLAEREREMQLV